MSARFAIVALAFFGAVWISQLSWGQGFGGLGTSADGYDVPKRGKIFSFPKDHGAHPQFRIEWWYLTSNLMGEDGREYGVQWTLFRSAISPTGGIGESKKKGWGEPQLWMGHAAVTTPESHFVAEARARGGVGVAGVNANPYLAWINDWKMQSTASAGDALSNLDVQASGPDFSYALKLSAEGPLVLHGDAGYSVKSAGGQASYYYSQPHYEVSGKLTLPTGTISVKGSAWLDREWSSQPLASDQNGWDWLSLRFDDGSKLMGFGLRQTDGSSYTSATWISKDGVPSAYNNGALKMTPVSWTTTAGRSLPTHWRVELPARGLDVEVKALNGDAWMKTSVPYWEGPIKITGSHAGRGYLEMTGYKN